MLRPLRYFLAAPLLALVIAGGGDSAHAISNPSAILWGSPDPAAFVTSLYVGVLGRPPESPAAVAGWAAHITGDIRTRLQVFEGFINSPEYHSKYPGGVQGPYTVWANSCAHAANDRFRVAVQMPPGSWSAQNNQVALNYGLALVGYYMVAFPFHPC